MSKCSCASCCKAAFEGGRRGHDFQVTPATFGLKFRFILSLGDRALVLLDAVSSRAMVEDLAGKSHRPDLKNHRPD